ncbi:hypothetical protein BH10PLA1_BH10PLA1_00830 [soil metagenome]
MRILHVISSLDRRAGGPPVVLAGLALAQSKLGAHVSVISTAAPEADRGLAHELREAGIDVTLVGPARGKFQRHPQIKSQLHRLITAADVVHIHTLWEEIQHQAAVISRRLGKPYVFVPHGMLDPWSLSQNRWLKRAFLALRLRRDLNGAAFLHVLNRDEARLIEPLRLSPPCEVISNGIDLAQIYPLPARGSFRAHHPKVGDAPYVLFLSRLHPKKGLDHLADAFAIIAAQRPDVKLVVAGPDDGAEKEFDQRIAAAGLTPRVLRTGPIYGQDKLAAIVDASLFVLPSRQEGFSVAIVESLACGTPVVISEACHFPEVRESGAGIVVPLEARAIAEAMLALLNNPARREAASAAASKLGRQYTWDRIASRTLELYGRPGLAILANSMTPYRIALHQRLVREMPEISLHSLFTHAQSNAPWELNPPAEIGPVSFTGAGGAWGQGGALIDWLRRNRPRAVIVNGYNDACRLRVLRWCKRHGMPLFLWGDSNIRGDRATGLKSVVKSALVRWAVRQSAGVMPCGSLGKAYFEKYGADPKRVFWMPYEPDYALIRNLPAEKIELARQRFGLTAGRRRIVYSGRLIDIKRVDLLLRAFADIAAERPEWDLVIVGDGPLRQSLAASVSSELASRITWTGFIGEQAMVSAIYRCCDVLAHPPDVEPWALVINEAAAAGLAIVSSDAVGAAAELVRDGVNGRIFPAGDGAALRSALLDVTAVDKIDAYKAASAEVLAAWQRRGDPVNGVRMALASTADGIAAK